MPEILAFLPRRVRARSVHLPLSFLSPALLSAPFRSSMPKLAVFLGESAHCVFCGRRTFVRAPAAGS
jgi:hypothetical protein